MSKTILVHVDADELLSDIDTDDLIEELNARDEFADDGDWQKLYDHLALGRESEALKLVKEMVQLKTGRLIP